jgi:membrane-bound serine protease (ClpP class)
LKIFRIILLAALLAALPAALGAGTIPSHSQSCGATGGYYVAQMNGNIDPGAADFLSSSVANAEAQCAHTLVFVLTTNGGDGGSMESMIGSIQSYQQWGGNFTTLVAPEGAFAFSAGSYIAESSDKIVMAPGTTIGSATPIVSGIPTGEENTTLTKDINAFASYMQTLTSAHGRNATATALMVTKGVSYCSTPASEAIPCPSAPKEHVVDLVLSTSTLAGALSYLGVPSNAPINTPGVRSYLISVLSDPNVSSLLFLVGVFAVLADIYHPTLILSIVGIAVIAISLFGLGVFGASPLAIFLMIVGTAFIFLEVKTQHGISALVGVVIFIVGFLLIYQFPPGQIPAQGGQTSGAAFSGATDITYGILVGLGAAIVLGSLYLRSIREGLKNRPRVNDPSTLIGKEGTMESDLVPGQRGVALIASEEWSVTSTQELKRGDLITVKGVAGLALAVEKLNK